MVRTQLENYPLFYEVSYTTKQFINQTVVRVSNRSLGQLLRRWKIDE